MLVRDLRGRRDRLGWGLLAALLLGSSALVAVPLSSTVARDRMARYHARGSWAGWALLQGLPAMYGFRNRAWTLPGTVPPGTTVGPRDRHPDGRLVLRYVNHHTYRAVVHPGEVRLPESACATTVLMSDYRGDSVKTRYLTCADGPGRYRVTRRE